jgi:hypothetical protein
MFVARLNRGEMPWIRLTICAIDVVLHLATSLRATAIAPPARRFFVTASGDRAGRARRRQTQQGPTSRADRVEHPFGYLSNDSLQTVPNSSLASSSVTVSASTRKLTAASVAKSATTVGPWRSNAPSTANRNQPTSLTALPRRPTASFLQLRQAHWDQAGVAVRGGAGGTPPDFPESLPGFAPMP